MVKLTGFEYRKHFAKPSVLIALLVFSLISIGKIYNIYTENSLFARGCDTQQSMQVKQLYWEFYSDFSGEITTDKIENLLAIYRPIEAKVADLTASTRNDDPNTYTGNIYTDYHFFRLCFVLPMQQDYLYQSYANKVVLAAKQNIGFYSAVNNQYESRKNTMIAECFSGRRVENFAFTEMYQYYLNYDFSSFLVLLLCIYGLVGVFVSEKQTEMDALLLTTKYGGTKTVVAKLLSSGLFVAGICIWFWMLDFFAFSAAFGSFKGALAPLYAVKNFADTPLNLSLGQYALLSGTVKTVGLLVLGAAVLLLSNLFKNVLFPFAISLLGAFVLIFGQAAFMGSGHLWAKVTNPFVLMVNRALFRKAEFVNLLGLPVPSYLAAMLAAMLWAGTLMALLAATMRKSELTRKRGRLNAG